MTKKVYLGGIVAVLLALCAGWYFGSPSWTLSQMRSAAQDRDADKLSSYIDFPTLRTSLKDQMKARLAVEMTKSQEQGGFAAIGAAFAMNMVDGMVEGFVTPEALRAMFANENKTEGDKKGPLAMNEQDLQIEREGLSEFRLIDKKQKGGTLVFKRDGLGWKLSEVRIPAE